MTETSPGERRALLDRLWQEGRAFDAEQPDRRDRRRNLEPESAQLLNILVCTLAWERVLELGTSNGYSTLWLSDALEATSGRVLTVGLDPGRAAEVEDFRALVDAAEDVRSTLVDVGARLLLVSRDRG